MSAPLRVQLFLFLAPQRQHARVFRHLTGSPRRRSNRSPPLLALVVIFRALQHIFRFGQTIRSILLRTRRLRNRDSVARLQQIQRNLRARLTGRKLLGGHVDGVLRTFQHIELGIDGLFKSFHALRNNVFRHYLIAGVRNGVIRLSRQDQAKRLQVRRDIDFVFSVIPRHHLAQVDRAPIGGDRPQHISQKLASQ